MPRLDTEDWVIEDRLEELLEAEELLEPLDLDETSLSEDSLDELEFSAGAPTVH